ncbi:hypothetical protein RRG08_054884 [Elysia crispata]|uniref:Uncharacterized protein n=1 Tax=Elysia crispata TaxID=231223 RepID=A0AAE1DTB1_9GAST|nr:hypothetical protein RRG08_054884 [Elysia crispata]
MACKSARFGVMNQTTFSLILFYSYNLDALIMGQLVKPAVSSLGRLRSNRLDDALSYRNTARYLCCGDMTIRWGKTLPRCATCKWKAERLMTRLGGMAYKNQPNCDCRREMNGPSSHSRVAFEFAASIRP